jgi:dTDP-4-amino-4,6-dideoxygalactose transaminase
MPGPGAFMFGKEEAEAAMEVLQKGYLFRYGSEEDPSFLHKAYSLEKEFADYCKARYALATTSGTASLLVSVKALGLRPGDEIIVPAYTFVASYSSCIFAGLVPVLTEIDDSFTIDPEDIERRITPLTRAIMPVHMMGNPCKMDEIVKIARKHNLFILEDCCQALGAVYKGRKVGTIGNIGAFSLNIYKTIHSGDGGLVITNDQQIYEKAFGFHDQGHKPLRTGVEVGDRNTIGLNFRMNELTAAVALAQLHKADTIISTLRQKRKKLKAILGKINGTRFRTLNDPDGDCATLCTVIFESGEKASEVCKTLGTKTLDHSGWHVYSNMEHIMNYFKQIGRPHTKGAYPKTDDLLSRAVNISVGVVDGGLSAGWGINILSSDTEIEKIAEQFIQACKNV